MILIGNFAGGVVDVVVGGRGAPGSAWSRLDPPRSSMHQARGDPTHLRDRRSSSPEVGLIHISSLLQSGGVRLEEARRRGSHAEVGRARVGEAELGRDEFDRGGVMEGVVHDEGELA